PAATTADASVSKGCPRVRWRCDDLADRDRRPDRRGRRVAGQATARRDHTEGRCAGRSVHARQLAALLQPVRTQARARGPGGGLSRPKGARRTRCLLLRGRQAILPAEEPYILGEEPSLPREEPRLPGKFLSDEAPANVRPRDVRVWLVHDETE